jgi:hypothetical protein
VTIRVIVPLTPSEIVGELTALINGLPSAAFVATGHRTACLSRVAGTHERVLAGDLAGAVEELRSLLNRVDGCGRSADRDDWIPDCGAQVQIRELIDKLIAALGR